MICVVLVPVLSTLSFRTRRADQTPQPSTRQKMVLLFAELLADVYRLVLKGSLVLRHQALSPSVGFRSDIVVPISHGFK